MSYSKDYRMSAIEYKKNKHTFKEMKKVFKITPRTYYKWVKNLENTWNVVVKIKITRRRKINNDVLKKAIEEKPDSCLCELTKLFNCSTTAVHKRLALLDLTYKKRLLYTPKNAKKTGQNILKK